MEFPRKRRGRDSQPLQSEFMTDTTVESLPQNPFASLLSTRTGVSAPSGIREAHSQMEKRRRDKMNHLIQKLSSMIPPHIPTAHKLDKLSVLRRAVQYLRSLRGMTELYLGENSKPSFIQDKELSHLILKAAEGFLFVVGCERGRIFYVSKSVSKTLRYDQASLIGQNLFDFLHPKDVAKVKEQLSCDGSPREKPIDTKTSQVYSHPYTGRPRMHSGSRRSFFFRMKSCTVPVKEEQPCSSCSKKKGETPGRAGDSEPGAKRKVLSSFYPGKNHRKFHTVHCTGYLRSWPLNVVGMEKESGGGKDSGPLTCLVAMGRLHPYIVPQKSGKINVRPAEFITRFAMNGKFVYVDQRATAILGYLPQELLGTSCYEYFHQDDHSSLTDKHKAVLQSKEKILTDSYKFRVKDGAFVTLKSEWFSFTNPWTKELEYIVSVNTLVLLHSSSPEDASPSEEVRDDCSVNGGNAYGPASTREPFAVSPSETEVLEAARQHQSTEPAHPHGPLPGDSAQLGFDVLCDSDSIDMAAFMNYLEAEGGLGDPGDFSDIQWAL